MVQQVQEGAGQVETQKIIIVLSFWGLGMETVSPSNINPQTSAWINDPDFNAFKKDVEDRKQMILFVGAGINYSTGTRLLWVDVMHHLFCNALQYIAREKGIDDNTLKKLKALLGISSNNEKNNESGNNDLYKTELLSFFRNHILGQTATERNLNILLDGLSMLKYTATNEFPLLITWVDRYVLLRRVAGGGPFDERELDVLRLRYCEGWLSGDLGYKASYAVSQINHWEKKGSLLVTQRLSDAARLAIEEWRDELSNRPEEADIDSPETLRKLSLLRGAGTVWTPRKAGKLLPVVERMLSRTVSSFSTKALEAVQPLSLFLDERWLARRGQKNYALDILRELARRSDPNPYARKAYGMLREILVECNGN